jgi:hypothetical protein
VRQPHHPRLDAGALPARIARVTSLGDFAKQAGIHRRA